MPLRNYIRTKIVVTLGPASHTSGTIERLMKSGASIFRLNFSHADHIWHGQAVEKVRAVSRKLGRNVCILADLQGPKVRTGKTPGDGKIRIKKNSRVTLTSRKVPCSDEVIHISYPGLTREVKSGHRILINDGILELKALQPDAASGTLSCRVMNSGWYASRKGVNFPDTHMRVPSLTAKDRKDLSFILSLDIDMLALSFVRSGNDMRALRKSLAGNQNQVKVIAKIEKPEAVADLSDILRHSDGIMVARGDLGVEISPAKVPIVQKNCIEQANQTGKFVIVATQMLESMIINPSPTRAETSDVANAVLDGTDALMLSGETSSGAYPEKAVKTMRDISARVESSAYYSRNFRDLDLGKGYPPHAVCEAAAWAGRDLGNIPVIVFTMTGATAAYLSKIRYASPILALSPSRSTVQQLAAAWNVTPFVLPVAREFHEMIKEAEALLLRAGALKKGQLAAAVCGESPVPGAASLLKIFRVGENASA